VRKKCNKWYHWKCGDKSANIRAKTMRDACIVAAKAQIPKVLDDFDKEQIVIESIRVFKGKY